MADYLIEARHLLSDSHTYKKLCKDPLPTFTVEVQYLVKKAHDAGVINK